MDRFAAFFLPIITSWSDSSTQANAFTGCSRVLLRQSRFSVWGLCGRSAEIYSFNPALINARVAIRRRGTVADELSDRRNFAGSTATRSLASTKAASTSSPAVTTPGLRLHRASLSHRLDELDGSWLEALVRSGADNSSADKVRDRLLHRGINKRRRVQGDGIMSTDAPHAS